MSVPLAGDGGFLFGKRWHRRSRGSLKGNPKKLFIPQPTFFHLLTSPSSFYNPSVLLSVEIDSVDSPIFLIMELDDVFNSSDIEFDAAPANPFSGAGKESIAAIIANATEDRIASKKFSKQLTFVKGRPGTQYRNMLWFNRFETYREHSLRIRYAMESGPVILTCCAPIANQSSHGIVSPRPPMVSRSSASSHPSLVESVQKYFLCPHTIGSKAAFGICFLPWSSIIPNSPSPDTNQHASRAPSSSS